MNLSRRQTAIAPAIAAAILVGALVLVGGATYEVIGSASGSVVSTSASTTTTPSPISVVSFTVGAPNATEAAAGDIAGVNATFYNASPNASVIAISVDFNTAVSLDPPDPIWQHSPLPANSTRSFEFGLAALDSSFQLKSDFIYYATFTFSLSGESCGPYGCMGTSWDQVVNEPFEATSQ
jgi:hypothetical protein